MKTLIVYYSFTRNNAMLARRLQQMLQCDIHEIKPAKRRYAISILFDLMFDRVARIIPHNVILSSYDHCIFICPIWAGKLASPLRTFLKAEKYHINRYSFITVCGGGNSSQRERLTNDLTKILEQEPRAVEELWVNDLLADDKKNTIKYTSGYRLREHDIDRFSMKIDAFFKKAKLSPAKSEETQHVGQVL